jgi:hypothetical protein
MADGSFTAGSSALLPRNIAAPKAAIVILFQHTSPAPLERWKRILFSFEMNTSKTIPAQAKSITGEASTSWRIIL